MTTRPHRLLASLLLLACAAASAQTPPLTGKMLDGPPAVAASTEPARPGPVAATSASVAPVAPVASVRPQGTPATVAAAAYTDVSQRRPDYRRAAIGTATRNLLRQQVNGNQAGAALPVLGASATLSHQRYLDSFKYPIPERFESRLSASKSTPD